VLGEKSICIGDAVKGVITLFKVILNKNYLNKNKKLKLINFIQVQDVYEKTIGTTKMLLVVME